MPQVMTYIGGAGVGKTTTLLSTMEQLISGRYPDPRLIGFISFTKAAREEAAGRAADRFNLKAADLEQDGWFRTIHSACYKLLGIGDRLLVPGKESFQWISNAVGQEVASGGEFDPDNEFGRSRETKPTPADAALGLWSYARAVMRPLAEVYDRAAAMDPNLGDLRSVERVVAKYEQQKRLDNRMDFTDLLSQYAGVAFSPTGGPIGVSPLGEVPQVPVWFVDEAQDNSPLMDRAARRLVSRADLVYLSGDPFQSIFGFAGSDHTLFQKWDSARRKILDQSYRCPPEILEMGENCLRKCSDYWDRGIKPSARQRSERNISPPSFRFPPIGREDRIFWTTENQDWEGWLDPRQDWLLLARTNFQARRLMSICQNLGIPWKPIKGRGGWSAPRRNAGLGGLMAIEEDTPVDHEMWDAILAMLPVKHKNIPLLQPGFKARWERGEFDQDDRLLARENLAEWGATPEMLQGCLSGQWVDWCDKGHGMAFRNAVKRYGWTAAMCKDGDKTGVRVGTIHSAKGMEGSNVLVLTSTSAHVDRSASYDQRGLDEEARIRYVAATRARDHLIIADERTKHRMEFPES